MNFNLFALVKASSECTALLGVSPCRFFEFGQAPELEQTPYATYQPITGTPYNVLTGPAEADHITVQVDVWADTSGACRATANAIREAVELNCIVRNWLGCSREENLYRITFMVDVIDLRF